MASEKAGSGSRPIIEKARLEVPPVSQDGVLRWGIDPWGSRPDIPQGSARIRWMESGEPRHIMLAGEDAAKAIAGHVGAASEEERTKRLHDLIETGVR